jgi:hypothetical protein
MKHMILFISLAILLVSITACTPEYNFFAAQTDASSYLEGDEDTVDVDFNFCTVTDEEHYISCEAFALTADTLSMEIEVTSSDVATLDGIVFELPDEGKYCTADVGNEYLWTEDGENYYVHFSAADAGEDCDFSSYVGQDTQLAFQLTLTTIAGDVVTLEGDVEDKIE